MALGGREGDASGVAEDLALANSVLGGEPVPDGDVECCTCGVAVIKSSIGTTFGKLRRIDPIGVVENEIRQQSGAGLGDLCL